MQCEWIHSIWLWNWRKPLSYSIFHWGEEMLVAYGIQEKENDVPNPQMIESLTKFMALGNSNCESNEYDECHEELSVW